MSITSEWNPLDAERVKKLDELNEQIESGVMNKETAEMLLHDLFLIESESVKKGYKTDVPVLQKWTVFFESGFFEDAANIHSFVFENFSLYYRELRSKHESSDILRAVQQAFDQYVETIIQCQSLWPALVRQLHKEQADQLDFLAMFRYLTLKRLSDVMLELARWDLEKQIPLAEFAEILELLRKYVPQTLTKFLKQSDDMLSDRYEGWQQICSIPSTNYGDLIKKFADELRFMLIQPIADSILFKDWGEREFRLFSDEWQKESVESPKKMFFGRINDRFKSEIQASGLMSFPEKVGQWFGEYTEKVKSTYSGDTSWLIAMRARVFGQFLLDDNMKDTSMKRIKWVANLSASDFADDQQQAEVQHKYLIMTKLNEIYSYLEEKPGSPDPETIYKPKNDEQLRTAIQEHVKSQVPSRKLDILKHKRVLTVAFYNNGKYDIKHMLQFVSENKRNSKDLHQFIIWLFGEKSLVTPLDSSAQKDFKSSILWFLEMEILPNLDENTAKLYKECEHTELRKFIENV